MEIHEPKMNLCWTIKMNLCCTIKMNLCCTLKMKVLQLHLNKQQHIESHSSLKKAKRKNYYKFMQNFNLQVNQGVHTSNQIGIVVKMYLNTKQQAVIVALKKVNEMIQTLTFFGSLIKLNMVTSNSLK